MVNGFVVLKFSREWSLLIRVCSILVSPISEEACQVKQSLVNLSLPKRESFQSVCSMDINAFENIVLFYLKMTRLLIVKFY